MNWSKRMNRVIEYIESNLDRSLDLDEVAAKAFSSKYHFHRMFLAHFGISVAEYVRKRRLTLASAAITSTDQRVIDIAADYGYTSPNAFTRAFREWHGVNPNVARKSQTRLRTFHRLSYSNAQTGDSILEYTIVKKPAFRIVGKRKTFQVDEFFKQGPQFWKDYVRTDEYNALWDLTMGRVGAVSAAPLMSVYIPHEDGCGDEFSDVLGVESQSNSDTQSFEVRTIPAATYAEFNCPYHAAVKTNKFIYGEWFAASGYERDSDKPDIAAYFPKAFRPMREMGVRWWIPVVAR